MMEKTGSQNAGPTPRQAASLKEVAIGAVYEAIWRKRIRAKRDRRGHWRIDADSLQEWAPRKSAQSI